MLGFVSFGRIPMDLLPEIELPSVSISTQYSGASPDVVEAQVTQIVEEIVATVPGVVRLTSSTSQGSCSVRVTFAWNVI